MGDDGLLIFPLSIIKRVGTFWQWVHKNNFFPTLISLPSHPTLQKEEREARDAEQLEKAKKLTPVQAFTGGATGLAIAFVLYGFTQTIVGTMDGKAVPENYQARQMTTSPGSRRMARRLGRRRAVDPAAARTRTVLPAPRSRARGSRGRSRGGSARAVGPLSPPASSARVERIPFSTRTVLPSR